MVEPSVSAIAPTDASHAPRQETGASFGRRGLVETCLLVAMFFVYAGDVPPMVNEAHYYVKAKNFWQPEWCQQDLFAASSKAHTTFYVVFGWTTNFLSLASSVWIGRFVGWILLAVGLQQLCARLLSWRYASLGVAAIWITGIEYGDLAGEWVVGGIEAKVPAYGLMFLALAQLVDRRWNRTWILLGAASAFHVLSGGWAVVAAALTWWFTERGRADRRQFFVPGLFIGGAIALLGLIPALMLTLGTNAEDSAAAARIYTFYRIKHHLLPADFYPSWYLRHGALIAMTFLASRLYWSGDEKFRRLGWFTIGVGAIAATGLVIGLLPSIAPDLAAKLLRYYWFRLTDAIVPLMFGVAVMMMAADVIPRIRSVGVLILVISCLLVASSSYQRARLGVPPSASNDLLGRDAGAEPKVQQQVFRDWLSVCRWARLSTPDDEIFLTPRHQQTFKWYAHRAEVVNWKDVPQDAKSLREWYRRFHEIFPRRLGHVRVTIQYAKLREFRQKYGVNFMIVDRRVAGENLPLVMVYPTVSESNATFAVYQLPEGAP